VESFDQTEINKKEQCNKELFSNYYNFEKA